MSSAIGKLVGRVRGRLSGKDNKGSDEPAQESSDAATKESRKQQQREEQISIAESFIKREIRQADKPHGWNDTRLAKEVVRRYFDFRRDVTAKHCQIVVWHRLKSQYQMWYDNAFNRLKANEEKVRASVVPDAVEQDDAWTHWNVMVEEIHSRHRQEQPDVSMEPHVFYGLLFNECCRIMAKKIGNVPDAVKPYPDGEDATYDFRLAQVYLSWLGKTDTKAKPGIESLSKFLLEQQEAQAAKNEPQEAFNASPGIQRALQKYGRKPENDEPALSGFVCFIAVGVHACVLTMGAFAKALEFAQQDDVAQEVIQGGNFSRPVAAKIMQKLLNDCEEPLTTAQSDMLADFIFAVHKKNITMPLLLEIAAMLLPSTVLALLREHGDNWGGGSRIYSNYRTKTLPSVAERFGSYTPETLTVPNLMRVVGGMMNSYGDQENDPGTNMDRAME